LDAETAAAFSRWKFKPALRAGVPVAVELIVNQPFDLAAAKP
jgi:outer membrane biosynthesis protein TonB